MKQQGVYYEAFDFHAECSKMRWDRLSILMDRLAKYQEAFSYFLQSPDGSVLFRQVQEQNKIYGRDGQPIERGSMQGSF